MGAYLIYFQLELKKAGKILPRLFAGAIVLVAILGTIAFSAGKYLYHDKAVSRITIGVVLPEEDSLAETAMRMLSSLESVKSVCDIEYIDEATGREGLKAGRLHALMVVPDGFIADIITGVNTPVIIVLSDNPGVETMIFRELVDSGVRTLAVAQASIYAADELCIRYQMAGSMSQVEDELNRIYFTYSLPRIDYFRNQKVSAAEDVTMMQYYGISAMVLFLFFCGIPLAPFCKAEKPAMIQKLELIGINRGMQILAKIISVTVLIVFVSALGIGALSFMDFVELKLIYIPVLILVCMTAAAVIVSVYMLMDNPIAGVMCLFWLTVIMLFLSGGFVPSVFLPDAVRQLKYFVPATYLADLLKVFIGGKLSWPSVLGSFLWGLGFYIVAVVIRRRI